MVGLDHGVEDADDLAVVRGGAEGVGLGAERSGGGARGVFLHQQERVFSDGFFNKKSIFKEFRASPACSRKNSPNKCV